MTIKNNKGDLKMKYLYQNWTTNIFMGFYESALFNSDTEYYINENMRDSEHPEVLEVDWIPYQTEISQAATDLLSDYCINNDNIIKSMQFKSLFSPKYYNYDTDRLNILMDINLTKLKNFIKSHKADFNLYLKDNFTSYDGFISYIENNYYSFFEQYKEDKNRCINVMIEYYILNQIYGNTWQYIKKLDCYTETPYHWDLFDANQTALYNNLKTVENTAA